jgi:signal transduction histidine kinase
VSASTGRALSPADTAVALGFVVAAAVEFGLEDEARLWVAVPGACLMLVLGLRRTRPLLAVAVFTLASCLAILVQAVSDSSDDSGAFVVIVAMVVMMYSLGAHADRRRLLLGCWQPVVLVALQDLTQPTDDSLVSGLAFFTVLVVALPVGAGRLVRSRRRLVAGLRQREQQLAAAHQERLAAARAAEALRLSSSLDELLRTGLERLEALAVGGDPDDAGAVETEARELLARTRQVVVELNRPAPVPAAGSTAAGPEPPRTSTVLALAGLLVAWTVVGLLDRMVLPMGGTIAAALVTVALAFPAGALPRLRSSVAGLLLCLAGIAAAFGLEDFAGAAVFAVLAWLAGRLAGGQARLAARLRRTTAELAELQSDEVERARVEERASTAHELHDSIGHALTAITLQAEAARRLGADSPERTREVLGTIGQVAAGARLELASGFAGGRDLSQLVDGARAAGLRVDVDLDESAVPDSLRHVVYRVLQEALTNVLRHAPGALAEVRLCTRGGELGLVVSNGPGVRPAAPGTEVGLSGMRRRIESAGGRLAWATRPDGGFELRASFAGVGVG